MIEPTPYSFLSPRARIRAMAAQDLACADKSHLEPPTLSARYSPVYEAIKAYYLSTGHDLEAWLRVTVSPALFNLVWCEMLGIKYEGKPPASVWRFQTVNINQSINR